MVSLLRSIGWIAAFLSVSGLALASVRTQRLRERVERIRVERFLVADGTEVEI